MYFGAKARIGTDMHSGLVHTEVVTSLPTSRSPKSYCMLKKSDPCGLAVITRNVRSLCQTHEAIVARWQLNTDQTTVGNLAAYDVWLDAQLVELDQALADAKIHGIKLSIDLHATLGGRIGKCV